MKQEGEIETERRKASNGEMKNKKFGGL